VYNRSGLVALFVFLLIATMALMAPSHLAMAQSETPTPTPTPAYQYEVQLSSGATLLVERRISYGEIAVVGTVLLLLVGSIIFWILRTVRLWIY
jgi:hypothetical protein